MFVGGGGERGTKAPLELSLFTGNRAKWQQSSQDFH